MMCKASARGNCTKYINSELFRDARLYEAEAALGKVWQLTDKELKGNCSDAVYTIYEAIEVSGHLN